jgi:myo-inositol-1(or 4)-monophosphatase
MPSDLQKMTGQVTEIVNATHRDVFGSSPETITGIATELKDGHELVSEYDRRASDLLIERLRHAFPGIAAVSEESPPGTFDNLPEIFWLIDPLDGTMNFVRGIPYASISVSLVTKGKPVIGVTRAIFNGDIYHAFQGGGFFKNGEAVRRKRNDGDCKILSTGFPHQLSLHTRHLKNLNAVFHHFTDIRRFASCCLDMCLLCEGKLDVLFEIVRPWDFYAGVVMAEETGLKYHLTTHEGPFDRSVYFVCGDDSLVDAIVRESDLSLDR